MAGTRYQLEINPQLPARLARLEELANNLWYSWDRPTRNLFSRLNPKLWGAVNHSPKSFLKRINQQQLDAAAEDPVFLGALGRVLSAFDTYQETKGRDIEPRLPDGELVVYFCAEFGFHESLPIYSGGLGILAGDHCKTASDLNLPFVAIGLLYRQGYFLQTIDGNGQQTAIYTDADFEDLPIKPVLRADGSELHISLTLHQRKVEIKVWEALIGHVRLYLLDTDVACNNEADCNIAHRLYGGDRSTRIEQEIILGIGGARALAEMGLKPTVWHINEGHAAFMILERTRQMVQQGMDFNTALEAVACNTIFTTHTAVPAGHDHFSNEAIAHYFNDYCDELKIDLSALQKLGSTPDSSEFNMTALAVRGSRFQNGVSRIHGGVSADICTHLWPQIEAHENPISYVTNGVHVPTFLSDLWFDVFDRHLGLGWNQRLTDQSLWSQIETLPDHVFWSVRQSIKSKMLHLLRHRVAEQHTRNRGSESHIDRMLKYADPNNPNVLTIGFARRFATYKRATLLFQHLGWLRKIIATSDRPVLFIFAGKAHPADEPGQALIRRIAEVAAMPEFEGHILIVEGYDLHLARRLVAGVDVWLNNPVYPLEASGTSGMKAAINGVINLSVLDGWWGESYDGTNGWGIKPASESQGEARRDDEEARSLYELLQDKIIPLYYAVGPHGYSPGWVKMAKRSISTVTPMFNSARMVGEYCDKFYRRAAQQWQRYSSGSFTGARQIAAWKTHVRTAWSGVAMRRLDEAQRRIAYGTGIQIEVAVQLNGLAPEDVTVELLFGRPTQSTSSSPESFALQAKQALNNGEHLYSLNLQPDLCGKVEYSLRAYPYHADLTHPFEMGLMLWL
ncbi:MAG TPA: alpha-glucan family phosphorylase [Rhodocyclaceae bacterium]|nr:alpha-glucan family phosphorylase [Rhodocyclaceae bacterium]